MALTNDFNFNADFPDEKAAAEQKQKDASTWHDATAVMHAVKDASMAAADWTRDTSENLVKNIYESSPVAGAVHIAQGKDEPPPSITSALTLPRTSRDPATNEMLRHEHAFMGTVGSAAEWWGIGKLASVTERAVEPLAARLSPGLKTVIQAVSRKFGVQMGEERSTELATRTLAGGMTGAAITPAYGGTIGAISGQKQQYGPMIVLGAMFGAAGGALSPGAKAKVAAMHDQLHESLGPADKAGLAAFDNIARRYSASEKIPFVAPDGSGAAQRLSRVMIGKGDPIDKIWLRQMYDAAPQLFEHPLVRPLVSGLKQEAADTEFGEAVRMSNWGMRVPDEEIVNNMWKAMQERNPISIMMGGTHPATAAPEVATAAGFEPLTVSIPSFKLATGISSAARLRSTMTPHDIANVDYIASVRDKYVTSKPRPGGTPKPFLLQPEDEVGGPGRPVQPFESFAAPREPQLPTERAPHPLTPESEMIPAKIWKGPSTPAGTAVASELAEYKLPVGRSERDIPAVPKLISGALSPSQTTIMDMVKGSKGSELEEYLIGKKTNQMRSENLAKLVVTGYLEPDSVTDPTVARVIGSVIRGVADDLPFTANAQREQLFEIADDFNRRDFNLRREEPPTGVSFPETRKSEMRGVTVGNLAGRRTPNKFVREPVSGDIVRVVRNDDTTVDVVDSTGRRATMRRDDAPQHRIEDRIEGVETPVESDYQWPFANADVPNELKKIEAAINGDDNPDVMPGPSPGPVILPPAIEQVIKEARESATDITKQPVKRRGMGPIAQQKAPATPTDPAALAEGIGFKLVQTKGNARAFEHPQYPGKHLIIESSGAWKYGAGKGSDATSLDQFLTKGGFAEAPADIIRRAAKGAKGFSKGAITIPNGKQLHDVPAAMIMDRLGGELWEVPQGFVTKDPLTGAETLYPDHSHAFEHAKRLTTLARITTEEAAGAEKSVEHLDPTSLTKKQLRKISAIQKAANALPVADIGKAAENARIMALLPGAEQPPLLQRMGRMDAHSYLMNNFIRLHARLMQYGDGGIQLANLSKQYSALRDEMFSYIVRKGGQTAKFLRTITNVRDLEAGKAAPEALKLFDDVIGSIDNETYGAAGALGIDQSEAPRITNKRYVSHQFTFKGGDIDKETIEQAQQMGFSANADGIAALFNDPEKMVPESREAQPSKQAIQDRMARVKWARERATAIAGDLEKARRGNAGFTNDVYEMFMRKAHKDADRLASAAVFGPKLENIDSNIAKIVRNGNYNLDDVLAVRDMMNRVRGRVHVPMSEGVKVAGNALRFWLSSSGPKHFIQNGLLIGRYGFTREVYAAMGNLLRIKGPFGTELDKAWGISVPWTNFELGEHPQEFLRANPAENIGRLATWVEKSKLPKAAEIFGNVGTAGLHVFLNVTRATSARLARNVFPALLKKALAGDADSLALLSETMHAKLNPTVLGMMDHDVLGKMFAKNTADWGGMTFHPEDMPMLANHPVGQQILRFRSFQWNLTHNIFQELTNPNFSMRRKIMFGMRLMASVPILGSLDPWFRHKMETGTVDSEVAYDSIIRSLKNPSHIGKDAYALLMLSIHGGMFGIMDSAIQGANLMNPDLVARSFSADPSIFAAPQSMIMAGAWATHGVLTGNRKYFDKGTEETLRLLGPVGTGFERHRKKIKPVRLPKHMVIREAFHAGP